MAPAPKARVQKGHVVANPEEPVPDEQLIDLGDDLDAPPDDVNHRRYGSVGSRSNTPATFGSSPGRRTTFFMRRSSTAADGNPNNPVPVRGNAVDMREHLKHLGPSNAASRPKTTRIQTVKIKPGTIGASPLLLARQQSAQGALEPYRDYPAPQGGEGEGLLKSAGKDASDGVQALQQGYGTQGSPIRSPPPKNTDENHKAVQADGNTSPLGGPAGPRSAVQTDSEDSQSDTLQSLPSGRGSPVPRKRNPARSGSITENIIDSGGVRKVVLETNSSSEDPEPSSNQGGVSGSNSKANYSSLSLTQRESTGETNEQDQDHGAEGEEAKKKPSKRRRKRKGGNKGEEPGPSTTS